MAFIITFDASIDVHWSILRIYYEAIVIMESEIQVRNSISMGEII